MSALQAVPADDAKPAFAVVYVTPDMAQRMLRLNHQNRRIRSRQVEAYARDMAAGDWHFTGEAVKFSADGTLIDGQHRLAAVVKSQQTIPMLVVRGLRQDSQAHMDTGMKRAVSDALGMSGRSNAANVAALARFAILLERNGTVDANKGAPVTHAEVYAWLDQNPDADAAVSDAMGYRNAFDTTPTAVAYAWLLLSRVDRAACIEFFHTTAHKMTNGPGDPRHALATRLQSARRSKERLSRTDEVGLIVRAWNAWRRGKSLATLPARTSGGSVPIPKAV